MFWIVLISIGIGLGIAYITYKNIQYMNLPEEEKARITKALLTEWDGE